MERESDQSTHTAAAAGEAILAGTGKRQGKPDSNETIGILIKAPLTRSSKTHAAATHSILLRYLNGPDTRVRIRLLCVNSLRPRALKSTSFGPRQPDIDH
jgi:hypothetical protein